MADDLRSVVDHRPQSRLKDGVLKSHILDTTSKNQKQPASLFLLVGLKPSHSGIPNQQTEKTSKSGSLYGLFIGFSLGSIFIFFFSFSLKGKGFTGLLVLLVLAS